jgi:DNA topoisomerase-1
MEKTGVGRPSTYASTVRILKKRGYVILKAKKLFPTQVGRMVVEFLEKKHPWILSPELTAEMEKKLDLVERGRLDWRKPVLETLEKVKELLPPLEKKPNDLPTPRQIEYARFLSEKLGKELPAEVLLSKMELSKWIDKAKKELSKEVLLTERQKAIIEKNGDEKVRIALQEGDFAYCRRWLDRFFKGLKRRKS